MIVGISSGFIWEKFPNIQNLCMPSFKRSTFKSFERIFTYGKGHSSINACVVNSAPPTYCSANISETNMIFMLEGIVAFCCKDPKGLSFKLNNLSSNSIKKEYLDIVNS